MNADLTGIENVGEFFSQHYVDELLVDDLKDLRAVWAQASGKSPPERLRALSRDFIRTMGEATRLSRPERLYELSHPVQVAIAEALDYAYAPELVALEQGRGLPVIHRVDRHGEPYLYVLEGRWHHDSEDGALDLEPLDSQMGDDPELTRPRASVSDLVLEVFACETPPRWILLISGADLILAERPKWGRGQYLRFDLSELLGRKDTTALAVTAGLTCRDALVPDDGAPVHDTLDENSHKHAHGVSSALKYAAHKAVELLGNEYVWYQRTTGKKAMYSDRAAAELTAECLTYLYRLLFLFYAETRAGELRSLPMDAEEYRLGYSLEALRDLELVPLTTPEAQDGFYIHDSLQRLFSLVDKGFHPTQQKFDLEGVTGETRFQGRGFGIQGLHSPLFDPGHTPRLSSVKFRNKVLQEVIRLLSLSGEGGKKRGKQTFGRGRISYAQLGINQLGAVYEGLLSYTGFFSRERLHEVHKAGEEPRETDQAFFVPESDIARYSEDQRLFTDPDGERRPRVYDEGTFLFRLAGRNRETSASYYTPEVLTRCLVKYSLKELLDGKTADEILALTVCEPALGSGAFVVEAVDQLADAYLQRKQDELGEHIPPERYALEKQKVKCFIATRNCYGVDLNPMAARLAEVSLWLATMHEGQAAPWFEARLGAGNSLVGARLAVWEASDLETDQGLAKAISKKLKSHGERDDLADIVEELLAVAGSSAADAVAAVREVFASARKAGAALENDGDGGAESNTGDPRAELVKAVKKVIKDFKQPRYQRKPPTELSLRDILNGKHSTTSIYHFLLPDPGMSPFDKDKAVKELVPDAVKKLSTWRKTLSKGFNKVDIARLVTMSRHIDELLRQRLEERQAALAVSRGPAPVWGQAGQAPPPGGWRGIERRMLAHRLARDEKRAYGRLRRIMDLWAAQWSWPLEHAGALPACNDWWSQVEEILGVETELPRLTEQLELTPLRDDFLVACNDDDTPTETGDPGSLAVARLVPFHWPLEFPEVFAARDGFDLVVGNPPWIKLQWHEQGILGDLDPRVVLAGLSAAQVARQRTDILGTRVFTYMGDFERLEGTKAFLNVAANHPLLQGVQTNLYKCFIEQGWRLGGDNSVLGLIHQDGVFDDPKGGELRAALFSRLRHVYRFKNELILFADIDHQRPYCLTVSDTKPRSYLGVWLQANLFHPKTIDESWQHSGEGQVPGIKTEDNQFETRGHKNRLIRIGETELALFASLLDPPGTPLLQARLPIVHSREILNVLAKLARHPRRLADLGDDVFGTELWHETNAQKDGTIRRETRYPKDASEWIVSGPHFYIGNPFNKSPRENCRHNQDYDVIDLQQIADDYLPRTNYVPACSPQEYRERIPRFKGKAVTDYYRHAHRTMVAITGERTAIGAILPKGIGHVDLVFSVVSSRKKELFTWAGMLASIPADFIVRATGKGHLRQDVLRNLPLPGNDSVVTPLLLARWLRLNCLTMHYTELWNTLWNETVKDSWSVMDVRLDSWPVSGAEWSSSVSVRHSYGRRQTLVEIDALSALELSITADELCTIYRTQFPVLRDYENNTWYDANGRIAFTSNRGLPGVGLKRKDFERWQAALEAGEPTPPDIDTQGLKPPFDRRDREEDMRRAYFFFADKLGIDIPENHGDT
ncbi:MAG: hypothetical protein MJE77_24930 [Proteobacteria bacterium]|nr:hypothetical protein [Pseudomonadota bacterium]